MLAVGRAVDKILALKTPDGEGIEDVCENSLRGSCEFASIFHTMKDQACVSPAPPAKQVSYVSGPYGPIRAHMGPYGPIRAVA